MELFFFPTPIHVINCGSSLCFCVFSCLPKDDEIAAYRQRILGLVEDCLEVLTPNTALEHVLKSLLNGQQQGVVVPRRLEREHSTIVNHHETISKPPFERFFLDFFQPLKKQIS